LTLVLHNLLLLSLRLCCGLKQCGNFCNAGRSHTKPLPCCTLILLVWIRFERVHELERGRLNALASALRDSSPDLAATLASRPILEINMLPLTLSSPALFLLLVFRTNSAYGRWWEARKVWGSIINTCRDSARMSLAMIEQNEIKEQAVSQVAVFSRVLKYHLREPSDQAEALLRSEIAPILKPEHTEKIMNSKHKPMTLCGLMSDTIHEAAEGLTTVERLKLDQSVTLLVDYLGMCERIVKTPIPLVYTRHTARFLSWWLVFLPVCLYDQLPNNL